MATERDNEVRGDVVERARAHKEWTQVELASAAGVSASTVQRAERGDRTLSYRSLNKIARALGVHVSAIYDVEPLADEDIDWMEIRSAAEDDEAMIERITRVETMLSTMLRVQLGLPGAKDEAMQLLSVDPRTAP